MPGKRVQSTTRLGLRSTRLATARSKSFQELADEAFKDLLKKYRQPVGLKAALKESVREKGKS